MNKFCTNFYTSVSVTETFSHAECSGELHYCKGLFFIIFPFSFPQIRIEVTMNGGFKRKDSCSDYLFLNASHMYLSAVCSVAFLKYPYYLSSIAKWLKK